MKTVLLSFLAALAGAQAQAQAQTAPAPRLAENDSNGVRTERFAEELETDKVAE